MTATVEAITAEVTEKYGSAIGDRVRLLAPIFAKHLPDPRPTEADALRVLDSFDGPAALRALRDLGCFRPEPDNG